VGVSENVLRSVAPENTKKPHIKYPNKKYVNFFTGRSYFLIYAPTQ
jgi:hypothetical protein